MLLDELFLSPGLSRVRATLPLHSRQCILRGHAELDEGTGADGPGSTEPALAMNDDGQTGLGLLDDGPNEFDGALHVPWWLASGPRSCELRPR